MNKRKIILRGGVEKKMRYDLEKKKKNKSKSKEEDVREEER